MLLNLDFFKTFINGLMTKINNKVDKSELQDSVERIDKEIADSVNATNERIDTAISNSVADWNQNDETANDYIKNKPFYETDPVNTEIYNYTNDAPTWSAMGDSGVSMINLTGVTIDKFVEGQSYTVAINDESYNVVATLSEGLVILGNPWMTNTSSTTLVDNGEQFCIRRMGSNLVQFFIYTSATSETLSVTISTPSTEIIQLDEKFISYKPGLRINKGDTYSVLQPDGSRVDKAASDCAEIFNGDENNNVATGSYAHAEGRYTQAVGMHSHSEGSETIAFGSYSHSEGFLTFAGSDNQHVEGSFNVIDTENKYAHIVGNGQFSGNWTSGRSNAHTLDWEGNAWYAGSVEGTALILSSPNGTRFNITIGDDGVLTASEIVE